LSVLHHAAEAVLHKTQEPPFMAFSRLPVAILSVALAAVSPFIATAQAPSPQLASILDQMNTASQSFRNAQADVRYDNYTRVVKDHTIETGTIYVERVGRNNEMGAVVYDLGSDGKPMKTPSKILSFVGGKLRIYTPGVKQVDEFQAQANQAKYESFLTLGFGGSGKDLESAWKIDDQGSETLTDGAQQVKTEKLDLVSNDPSVRNLFSHVTIWIDPKRGISLKQIFYAPNGDNRTTYYSNIKLNGTVNKKPYTIPKDANVIPH
jgi:outer membrane lipoprotein-sorting protein